VYIGGSGLARGYLNRPELTAEKFIPNPFSNVPGARLYKTGDLARHFPDGTIEFLGRLDHQVKVRGFRIELGEIEAVLGQHPGVRESAVVVSEEVPGDKRLTAYVVPSNKLASSIDGLHLFLQEKLPDYMIPSAFVILENLPLTPSGKVDRRALPAPGKTRPDLAQAFVAPRTLVEYVLADIWRDVLDIEHIGINDNFFDLGGHSLLITRVIAQIERFLQVDLPVRSLFESPTIAQLAARIDADQNEGFHRKTETGNPSYWVKLQSGQSQTSLFCFPYIGGFRNDLFRFAKLARLVSPAYAFYGLQARGTDGVSQPHRQIKEMVTEYIKEMQTLQPQGPYFLLGECFSGAVAYATAQQLRAQGEHVAFLALLEVKGSQQSLAMYFWHRLTARLRYRIDCISELHLWRRIAFHLGEVKRLHPAQWFSYGFETTGKALRVLLYTLRGYTYVPAPAVVANGGNTERQKSKYLARAEKVYWLAVDRYRRQPYAGRITVFANEEWYSTDPTLGWNDLAAGGMEVHKIPGNHNTYITEYIQVVAKELRECLDRQGRGWIDEMKSGVN
jgi:thioesterase domain-containing protein